MKKSFVVFALTAILISFNLSAKSGYDMANAITEKTGNGNIYIGGKGIKGAKKSTKGVGAVGKIKVVYDGDLDFLLQTRNAKSSELNPDRYSFPGAPEKEYYESNEIFCNLVSFTKNTREVSLSSANTTPEYYFYSDRRMKLYLPADFSFTVPEGEQFVYLGTIVYHFTGDDFTLKSIEILDEYDEAQEEFNKMAGTDEFRLCRVQVK